MNPITTPSDTISKNIGRFKVTKIILKICVYICVYIWIPMIVIVAIFGMLIDDPGVPLLKILIVPLSLGPIFSPYILALVTGALVIDLIFNKPGGIIKKMIVFVIFVIIAFISLFFYIPIYKEVVKIVLPHLDSIILLIG